MAFKRMKGYAGLLYVPDETSDAKKHRCPDCHFCQWCCDERCELCQEGPAKCVRSRGATSGTRRPRPSCEASQRSSR